MAEQLELVELTPRMARYCNLFLSGQYSKRQIADLMGVSQTTVQKWSKRGDVQEYIEQMTSFQRKEVSTQLNALTNRAVKRLNELMDSPIDGVAMQAVKDVLDRGGHKPKQEIKKDVTIKTYEQQLGALMNSTMPEFIDVDATEVEDE